MLLVILLHRFKVKFNFVNETTARTVLSPFSYQYIEDPSSFGKFRYYQIKRRTFIVRKILLKTFDADMNDLVAL